MIKFFRHIRQKLIGQNKTRTYFLYAVGEIILVVIGILIAVQINSWNEDRKRLNTEQIILSQLKDEMLDIYGDIYRDFNVIKLGRLSHYNIIDYIESNATYHDSMSFDFYYLKQDEYIFPKEAIYSRIKEEGLDIIKNDSIRNLTQIIYESIFPRLTPNSNFNPNISRFLDSYYQDHFQLNTNTNIAFEHVFDTDTLSGQVYSDYIKFPVEVTRNNRKRKVTRGFSPLNFEALKQDTKFRMLLQQTEGFRTYKGIKYRQAIVFIKALIALVDKELEASQE